MFTACNAIQLVHFTMRLRCRHQTLSPGCEPFSASYIKNNISSDVIVDRKMTGNVSLGADSCSFDSYRRNLVVSHSNCASIKKAHTSFAQYRHPTFSQSSCVNCTKDTLPGERIHEQSFPYSLRRRHSTLLH